MGLLKLVRASLALVAGTREEESLDPTDGGLNVHLVGGAVGGQTVAQGDPNAGGAAAWHTVDAAVLAELALVLARLADGTQIVAPKGLAPPTGATIAGDDAAHALGALTGAGHVIIAAVGGTVTIGSASVPPTSSTGFPVLAGASYDWQALLVQNVRIYVPAGVTAIWGAHQ